MTIITLKVDKIYKYNLIYYTGYKVWDAVKPLCSIFNERNGYLHIIMEVNSYNFYWFKKNLLGQMWQAITLNKTRNAIQSNFTVTQSSNIQIYVFEASLIQL